MGCNKDVTCWEIGPTKCRLILILDERKKCTYCFRQDTVVEERDTFLSFITCSLIICSHWKHFTTRLHSFFQKKSSKLTTYFACEVAQNLVQWKQGNAHTTNISCINLHLLFHISNKYQCFPLGYLTTTDLVAQAPTLHRKNLESLRGIQYMYLEVKLFSMVVLLYQDRCQLERDQGRHAKDCMSWFYFVQWSQYSELYSRKIVASRAQVQRLCFVHFSNTMFQCDRRIQSTFSRQAATQIYYLQYTHIPKGGGGGGRGGTRLSSGWGLSAWEPDPVPD